MNGSSTPPPISNRAVFALAAAIATAARWHPVTTVGVAALFLLAMLSVTWAVLRNTNSPDHRDSILLILVISICALTASVLAARALHGLHVTAGAWNGRVTLLSDPKRGIGGYNAIGRVDGKHVLVQASGNVAWRIARLHAGEEVDVEGRLASNRQPVRGWTIGRHLAGRLIVRRAQQTYPGNALARLANGVRATLLRSGSVMPSVERSLFAGFVLGDNTAQPPEVADDFRASGLTHLLVVSGQNVSFTLAVAEPLLRRLNRHARFIVVLLLLLVFCVVTRFEPSVIRAAVMAGLVAFTRVIGRPQDSLRIVGFAAIICTLIDPLLMWSVGFGLSIAACLGLASLARPIEALLPGPKWLVRPLATTLAAQATTALLIVPLFGGVPVVAPIANLFALPAAAPVMSWGVAAGIPAGFLGPTVSRIVHAPTRVLLWWVAFVARISAQIPIGQLGQTLCITLFLFALWQYRRLQRHQKTSDFSARLRKGRRRFIVAFLLCCGIPSIRAAALESSISNPSIRNAELYGLDRSGIARRANVLVLRHGVNITDVLTMLRTKRVRAVDVVIVASGGKPQASIVRAVRSRVPIGAVMAADRAFVGAADCLLATAGQQLAVGNVAVTVTSVDHGRLSITIG